MEKDGKRPKNKKFKHNRDKVFTPLTREQIERAERIARGEKVEEAEEEPAKVEKGEAEEERYKPRPMQQQRTFEMPEDSDEG
jgi:hypothetical protein